MSWHIALLDRRLHVLERGPRPRLKANSSGRKAKKGVRGAKTKILYFLRCAAASSFWPVYSKI